MKTEFVEISFYTIFIEKEHYNGNNEENARVRPPCIHGIGYRGFGTKDEYIAIRNEKTAGEGGTHQKPHPRLL